MKHAHSAGGIVLNVKGEVLITNQHGDSWSLPKGHLDPGEDALNAAKREIAEETGVTEINLVRQLISYTRYRTGKGGRGDNKSEQKTITLFLFTTKQKELKPTDPHNPEARWVTPEKAAKMLTHPIDKQKFVELWKSGAFSVKN